MAASVLLSGVLGFVVVPGCGGEDEPTEPPVPSLATAYCAALDACCAADGRTNDGPRCRADVAAQSCREGSECDSGICIQGYFCGGRGDGRVHGCFD